MAALLKMFQCMHGDICACIQIYNSNLCKCGRY